MPKSRRASIILLIADGFDEPTVSILVSVLREAGLPLILVGLRAGPVSSTHGLTLVPDKSLEQILEKPSPISALILPNQAAYSTRLRNDPRVGALLQRCIEVGAVLVGVGMDREDLPLAIGDVGHADVWLASEPGQPLEQVAAAIARRLQYIQGE